MAVFGTPAGTHRRRKTRATTRSRSRLGVEAGELRTKSAGDAHERHGWLLSVGLSGAGRNGRIRDTRGNAPEAENARHDQKQIAAGSGSRRTPHEVGWRCARTTWLAPIGESAGRDCMASGALAERTGGGQRAPRPGADRRLPMAAGDPRASRLAMHTNDMAGSCHEGQRAKTAWPYPGHPRERAEGGERAAQPDRGWECGRRTPHEVGWDAHGRHGLAPVGEGQRGKAAWPLPGHPRERTGGGKRAPQGRTA
ncbi:hypothetical protein SAMN05216188_118170 [Lentzea xinjiangensis]|uniref:Uncharacterized protein n=1 Tax=Lentzea xinjiangensis TaxID=402600 RepID=A0A1H9TKE6_9PSEU|nr:hypothetical protein SAMN05216188_118170 [Lentzea xinjiangensis]